MTRKDWERIGSAVAAGLIWGLTARMGGATVEASVLGAVLGMVKDWHAFSSTAPKDAALVAEAKDAS